MATIKRRARGTGSIVLAGKNRYVVSVTLPKSADGKRGEVQATVRGTKADAQARLDALRLEVESGDHAVDNRTMTVNDLLDRFISMKKLTKEKTTAAWYERNFRVHVRPKLGALRLRDLRDAHIESLLGSAKNLSKTKERGEALGSASLRNVFVGIRAALRWGVKKKLVAKNVADFVDAPEQGREPERVTLSLDDVRAILVAVEGSELEAVVPFALGTGLRRGEMCGLRWEDVDFAAGEVHVRRSAANLGGAVIIKDTKTKKSTRVAVCPPFVMATLRKHHAAQAARHLALGIGNRGAAGAVFDRADGTQFDPNEMSRLFSRMIRRHGLKACRLHDLRHMNATYQFAAGVPLKVVSESLGHSSIAVTSAIYVQVLKQTKLDAADALEGFLGGTMTPLPKPVAALPKAASGD